MKYHQLRALIATARTGSIHEAARTLHITQPAVTHALRELEADLGLPLIVRSSSGVALTAEGRLLLQRAELVVHEMTRTEAEMARLRSGRAGSVAIGVTPLAGMTILPRAYNRFRQAMPEVTLELVEYSPSQLVEQLKNGALDFALGSSGEPRDFASVRCVQLAAFPTWFAVSRDGALAGATALADLREAEWLHTEPSADFHAFIAALFGRQGLAPPRRITRCASQTLYYSLAVDSNVVTSWTHLALRSNAASDQLKTLDLLEQPPPRKLFLLYRDSMVLTAPAEYFVRCIEEAAKQEGYRATAAGRPDSGSPWAIA